jgi:hypothetical protein
LIKGYQLGRPYGSNVSAVSRKRCRIVPDASATSSRHSGLSPSLAMVSRIHITACRCGLIPSHVIIRRIDG